MPAGNLTPNLHVSGGGEVVIPMQRVDDPYTNIIHFISFVGFFLLAKSVSFHYSSIDLLCFMFLFITLCIDLCFNSIVCCITLCLICVSYSFYCIFQTFHSIHMCCFVSFHMVFLFLLACSLFVCVYFDCLHIHYCVSYSFY